MTQLFRIGEFSKMTKTTIKTLRHYDELGLLKPAFVDEENGYEAADFSREHYIDGMWNKEDPAQWLTEIQIPIKR